MPDRPHMKVAADAWAVIQLFGEPEDDPREEAERVAAAQKVIELACDAAVEADRLRRKEPV